MNKLKNLLTGEFIKQLFSYVCVGGTAAVAEWVMFGILLDRKIPFADTVITYELATALAFMVSTAVNYIMGRILTFRGNDKYKGKKLREIGLIYLVSIIGLGMNILLMKVFVELLGFRSRLLQIGAKILTTGIVFFWNFFVRRLLIYRKK